MVDWKPAPGAGFRLSGAGLVHPLGGAGNRLRGVRTGAQLARTTCPVRAPLRRPGAGLSPGRPPDVQDGTRQSCRFLGSHQPTESEPRLPLSLSCARSVCGEIPSHHLGLRARVEIQAKINARLLLTNRKEHYGQDHRNRLVRPRPLDLRRGVRDLRSHCGPNGDDSHRWNAHSWLFLSVGGRRTVSLARPLGASAAPMTE
jgi:hypothetical protein